VSDTSNPVFNHQKVYAFKPIKADSIRYLCEGSIPVELWAVQMPIMRDNRDRRNTAAMMTADALSKSMSIATNKYVLLIPRKSSNSSRN
jgi:hypothetical protein